MNIAFVWKNIFGRVALLLLLPLHCAALFAADPAADTTLNSSRMVLHIPKLERAPTLDEFSGGEANHAIAAAMAHAGNFIQNSPKDGEPATQRTDAYMGYDQKNIYVVFVAEDTHPEQVRAHLTRRENAFEDDNVEVTFDTFHDKRRGFLFSCNPLGIQSDALWSEGGNPDFSFDTLWHSEGKRIANGYVVLMSIPFRSLRFTPAEMQNWGVTLLRVIQRENEWDYWPHVSSKVVGRLNQAGTIEGLEKISPGRNIQMIPYGIARSFRAVDARDVTPKFSGRDFSGDIGLDAKIVLKDRFVLDATVNPDFSQVESDEPQDTVNQRFEVFFPEKRPFFLENSSFFNTPINLNFTRRIADPDYGLRLTGKQGPYAIGALFANDAAPGKSVAPSDPLNGKKAYFGLLRVNRDLGKQNSLGLIYTGRDFEGSFNRVGGVDGRFRWGKTWSARFQAVASATKELDGGYFAGPAYTAGVETNARKYNVEFTYNDNAEGFQTRTGFFRRPGIRRYIQFANYRWRPEGKRLVSYGPNFFAFQLYDRSGKRLEYLYDPGFIFSFKRNSFFGVFADFSHEKLRPVDFGILPEDVDFSKHDVGIVFGSELFKQLSFNARYFVGRAINFVPAAGQAPGAAKFTNSQISLVIKPVDRLQIDNTYILDRLRDPVTNGSFFNSHIIRSKWNYQFTRELSLRVIGQYNAVLSNPLRSSLTTNKKLNGDVLITYLVNPGTAVYVGYNSNLQNPDPTFSGTGVAPSRFVNDGKQVFVKVSYLFRY